MGNCTNTVCSCALTALDTPCIEITVTGVGSTLAPFVVSAAPIISPTVGNQITCTGNGLFVPEIGSSPSYDIQSFYRLGALTVVPGISRLKFPFAVTIINVTAAINTAPTGADIIIDVNLDGVTIFTNQANRPRILAGQFKETADAVPDITAVANDQYLQIDVDQVGSAEAGSDITVFIYYSRP